VLTLNLALDAPHQATGIRLPAAPATGLADALRRSRVLYFLYTARGSIDTTFLRGAA
jgi:hypothetical protein